MFLKNTVSVTQLMVVGTAAVTQLWSGNALAENEFVPINDSTTELSVGWVEFDEPSCVEFEEGMIRDEHLVFSLRMDKRTLPPFAFKQALAAAQNKFLAENPTFNRVPKDKNDELKDLVRAQLLPRQLPNTTLCDVVWNKRTNVVTVTSVSMSVLDTVIDLFQKTFDGLRLVMIHPMGRAQLVVPAGLIGALDEANCAKDGSVMEQIVNNRWLGREFLLWLMYRTANSVEESVVCCDGPPRKGEVFTSWLDNRVLLEGHGQEGKQKITAAGSQDNFEEICTALRQGKEIVEATIFFQKLEYSWRLTLKAELFQFASFKCPTVRLEKGADEDDERLSMFYERVHVVDEGLQLFDSLLAAFLVERLGDWGACQARINAWLEV